METHIQNFNRQANSVVQGNKIDLSLVDFTHPWAIGIASLLLIERQALENKVVILPKNSALLNYLKTMHFHKLLSELGYEEASQTISNIPTLEQENLDIQEIVHCRYVDELTGRLGRFEKMFKNFGLNDEDTKRAVVIVGELGNNVFDHNLGNWPTNFSGAIIVGQNYPSEKRIEFIVGDAGVGFLGSLRNAFPDLSGDIEAIKKGLGGYTGRIGENRGNGLKTIQRWTIKNFHGILAIHSGAGLVQVDENGAEEQEVPKILGTLAQFVIYYK